MHNPYTEFFNNIHTHFTFTQHANFSTHIYGEILDLVFHIRKHTPVEWLPSQYSDHVIPLIEA